eukprot:365706-Chlamydomonas_euryale.AAC.14
MPEPYLASTPATHPLCALCPQDRSFTFVLKTSPTSVLLKKAAGVASGSATPNKDMVGKVTLAQVEEIARTKMPDTNTIRLESVVEMVKGTAKNMGITVEAAA